MTKVRYNRDNLTIGFLEDNSPEVFYEVDLEECTDAAQMLDWIFQIEGNVWCTPDVLVQFFKCINDACEDVFKKEPQGVFCPFGEFEYVKWK